MTKKRTAKTFGARIWTYFTEMFPVLMYLPFILALYFCMNFTLQALDKSILIIDNYSIVGAISAFFLMLLIRNFDDLKDYELDIRIFPERPIPRGDVKKNDVVILAITSFVVLLLVNIIFAQKTLIVFTIMMVYALLAFIGKNPVATMKQTKN